MIILGILIIIFLFVPTYQNVRYYFSPHKAYLAGMLLFYVVSYYREKILNPDIFNSTNDYIHDKIVQIVLISFIFYILSFWFMYFIYYETRKKRGEIDFRCMKRDTVKTMSLGETVLIIFPIAALIIIKLTSTNANVITDYLGIIMLIPVTFLYFKVTKVQDIQFYQNLIFFVTFLALLSVISRFNALYLMLPIFLFKFYLEKRKVSVISVSLLLVAAVMIGSVSKTFSIIDQYSITGNIMASPILYIEIYKRIITIDFLDTYSNLVLIISHYPSESDFLYGKTLWTPIINFVPRGLWESKPDAFGAIIGEQFYPHEFQTSLAPSFIGEIFANLGTLGVVVSSVVVGVFSNHIEYKISRKDRRQFNEGLYLPFLLFIMSRGDLLLLSVLLYSYIPFKILYKIRILR